jgi:hypothetical protein
MVELMIQQDHALIGVRRAFVTLNRATFFLGAGLRTTERAQNDGARATGIEGPHRAKVIGNGLRELDRFLSLLLDEVAAVIAPPGLDRARFRRQRNTANKLRTIRSAMARPSPDHDRLLAIGRSRDCLFHCGGIVRRGDGGAAMYMTAGWPSPLFAIGERLTIDAQDLHSVCRFYRHVAADLLADSEVHLAANDVLGSAMHRDGGYADCPSG